MRRTGGHRRVAELGARRPPSSSRSRCPYAQEVREPAQESEAMVSVMTDDLISRARDGDGDAFRALTEPHRRELHVHCYRMLGSFQDAEDALQDPLRAAWQGFGGFEGRASLRPWLYRIATTRCLNARRASSRRSAKEWNIPRV